MALSLPFQEGQLLVAVLREPRERLWGRLLGLEATGLAMRGLDLQAWEEVLGLVRRGEADQVALATRFFPMHRVESLYLDQPSSGVPSLAEDFRQRTGVEPQAFLADPAEPGESGMTRLALFLSGTGGNALNLVQACRELRVPAKPVLALASSPKAGGIARLASAGLATEVLVRGDYPGDAEYSSACYARAEAAGAELIVLCGWLKKLEVPAPWAGRILNIHPGLLPEFGGPGMYGLHVHRAVLAAGVAESGCTVHLVDNLYDHGQVLAQARVPVLPGDTPELLQQRVYAQEMELYPRALAGFLAEPLVPGSPRG